jgi:hypothetical protein
VPEANPIMRADAPREDKAMGAASERGAELNALFDAPAEGAIRIF